MTDAELYREAIRQWGADAQLRMLQEECAEAIVAVNKLDRASNDDAVEHVDRLAEEVADVLIMAEQVRQLLGTAVVDDHKRRKLARLRERLAL